MSHYTDNDLTNASCGACTLSVTNEHKYNALQFTKHEIKYYKGHKSCKITL